MRHYHRSGNNFVNYLLIFIASTNLLFGVATAIHNGQNAELGQFPFSVFVKNSVKTCTGIILSSARVLTAAHCVCEEYGQTTVLAGVVDMMNKGPNAQDVTVQSIVYEPNYQTAVCSQGNFLPPNDLAILNLESSLSLSQDVVAANLDCDEPKSGSAIVSGFGADQNNNWGRLRYTNIKYYSCMDNLYLCSDRSRAQIAAGDSGGPMTTSSGNVNGLILGQDVDRNSYCNLSQYCSWINNSL